MLGVIFVRPQLQFRTVRYKRSASANYHSYENKHGKVYR
jgi:hypothetical protein